MINLTQIYEPQSGYRCKKCTGFWLRNNFPISRLEHMWKTCIQNLPSLYFLHTTNLQTKTKQLTPTIISIHTRSIKNNG